MESCAHAFDQPIDSKEHQSLATTAWMGGPLVEMRYWLGRLLNRNLFRESVERVQDALSHALSELAPPAGASVFANARAWSATLTILRDLVEQRDGVRPTAKPKYLAVLRALLANPDLTTFELAKLARTTEKQIARMSDVTVLRWIREQERTRIAR
jgi:hypothetical protein